MIINSLKLRLIESLGFFVTFCMFFSSASAGIYYSGETFNELPTQWRGLLIDQRQLRQIGFEPKQGQNPSELRKKYLLEKSRLEKLGTQRKFLPEEFANLGALSLRLGFPTFALDTLRKADREYPQNFRILANLASAWHALAEFDRAIEIMEQAIILAPGKFLNAERLHLFWLVQLKKQKVGDKPDNLYKILFQNQDGIYAPGTIDPKQIKLLPPDAIASAQLLALWFPSDPLLLIQLAEIANASGDPEVALAMMDGCVTEFGLREPKLLEHRKILKDYLQTRKNTKDEKHLDHKNWFMPKSLRPLALENIALDLPPVKPGAINLLPWLVLSQTQVDRKAQAQYPTYLKQLEGKKIQLEGYMQPVGEDYESSTFLLLENPVGCWYCEMPSFNGMVLIELKDLKVVKMSRNQQIVQGKLQLRKDEPEKFLFTILESELTQVP